MYWIDDADSYKCSVCGKHVDNPNKYNGVCPQCGAKESRELKVTMSECTRKNTCYDCDNEKCWYHGKKEADCPKYHCDREGDMFLNCDRCAFTDRYIEDMRKEYGWQRNTKSP